MKFWWFFLCIVLLSMVSTVFPQTSRPEVRLQQLKSQKGEEFRQNVRSVYDSLMFVTNLQIRKNVADKLFELTREKDEIAHIYSLLFHAVHYNEKEPGLFEQAYKLAEKYQRIGDITNVEYSRARFFLERMQYDSAMIYLLRYRDRTPPDLKGEGYRNIVNLIGDIYYRAGLYRKAREVYTSLLELYEAEHDWDFYRPYVMMNNLGLIGYKTGDLELAAEWYSRSMNLAEKHLQTSYRYNTIGYTKIKMAEFALAQDSLDVAGRLLKEVSEYPEGSIYEDVWQEYLYTRARLLLQLGKPDESEGFANALQPGDSLKFVAYRFVPEIFHLLADIYTSKQDYFHALQFENKYRMMQDSLKAQEHLAASMIIFADYNHELTRIELQRSEQRLIFAATGLIVVFFILLITLIFYRKLYRSKLELVRKSLEEDPSSVMQVPENGDVTGNGSIGDDEIQKQKELIRALKAMMEKQKPFLDPGLTIVDMARQLNTNRTYLSKAINNQLETTFPNFINQLRIRESIRLIISGYTKDRTQEALARQSGFANRNVFINAFKKYTGVLPSFFIANYKKWDPKKNRFKEDE